MLKLKLKMKQKFKKRFPVSGFLLMLVLVLSSFSSISLQAQNIVSGTIYDKDGLPLPGANVIEKGTKNGAITDFDGNYSITVGEQSTLIYSYIGFDSQEVSVAGRNKINITLKEGGEVLDEIVIVGYGTQKKESVVGAISQVKGADLMERAAGISNVEEALQGNLPGVTTIQGSGIPGQSEHFEFHTIELKY